MTRAWTRSCAACSVRKGLIFLMLCSANLQDRAVFAMCKMAWGALARPPKTVQAGPGESPMYPQWGSEVEHRGPTRKAVRRELGSECVVQPSPGSMAGQGLWEKASHPRTGSCCPLAKERGGQECGDWVSCTAILALLGPGEKLARGPVAEQNKKESKDSPPGLPPGERVVRSPSLEEQDPEAPGHPSQGCRRPWLGRGRGGLCRFPAASSTLRPVWRLLLWPSWSGGGGSRRVPSVTSRRKDWRQQRTTGAGCDKTPPSASVRWRTVGQSPPPLRRIGRPGRSGSPGSDACWPPSYPPRSAIGGIPGPLMWKSSDPGPVLWLSSPSGRGPSLCTVLTTHLGQHHPRATTLTPWLGELAGGPWRAGRKRSSA